MFILEKDNKIDYLITIRDRLKLFNIDFPENILDLKDLYFNTYSDIEDFFCDDKRTFQRLNSLKENKTLVIDECVLITQQEYKILKEVIHENCTDW